MHWLVIIAVVALFMIPEVISIIDKANAAKATRLGMELLYPKRTN